ncbi:MAG TPA: hypothetical protein VJV05_12345 [Pyrinomonadaceae bacterium]|nr:hypothetical protein [Pyrinomonadaceae bacterium]
MRTAVRKLWQISVGVMAILSLSVASVAACACSHHQAESEPRASCHSSSSHHKQKKTVPAGHHISQSCECVIAATKVSVKGEGFKLKKHAGASSATTAVKSARYYSPTPSTVTPSETSFYARSHYNTAGARGPPLT